MRTKQRRQSKSIRKFIRREKARIRSQVFDLKEREKLISEVYQKFLIAGVPPDISGVPPAIAKDNKETVKK